MTVTDKDRRNFAYALTVPFGSSIGRMYIDQYVERLFGLAPTGTEEHEHKIKSGIMKCISMYRVLYMDYGCTTLNSAFSTLERGAVEIGIVKSWIDSKVPFNPREMRAIVKGYPELYDNLLSLYSESLKD